MSKEDKNYIMYVSLSPDEAADFKKKMEKFRAKSSLFRNQTQTAIIRMLIEDWKV